MSENSDPIAEMISNDIVSGVLSNDVGSGGIISVPSASVSSPAVTVGGQVNVGSATLGVSTGGTVSSNQFTFSTPYAEPESLQDAAKDPGILKRIYMFLTRSVNESNYKHDFISNIITVHADRYWSVIRVNEQGQVYYKVFRGWFGGRWLYRCGILRGYTLYWESVLSREKLESTLGLAHLKIEELIKQDKKRLEKVEFIKAICKTDPDNLKIIAELDKLDKGIEVSHTQEVAFAVSSPGTVSGI